VARLIGETHNPRAPRVLGPLLASNHRDVRGAAASALASVGVAGVESVTAAALADSAPEVRLAAADALGKHGTAAALDAVLALWPTLPAASRGCTDRALHQRPTRAMDCVGHFRCVAIPRYEPTSCSLSRVGSSRVGPTSRAGS